MQTRRDFIKLSTFSAVASALPEKKPMSVPTSEVTINKTPTILLRSSWNDYNVGDIGHTPGTLRLLEQYIPESEILLWHENARPITEALIQKHFPKVKIIRGSFAKKDTPMSTELIDAFDKASVYIHNSGMGLNYGLFNYEWDGMIGNLTPMLYCIEKGIPFGTYGQSYDKFASPSLHFYRDVMNRASFIYCREKESVKFLQENQFKTPILEFGPDGCFGINVRDDARGLAYMKDNQLETGKFLIVNIRTNTPTNAAKGDMMNPLNTPEKQEEDRKRLTTVKELISYWVRETGQKVLIIPEAFKEGKHARTMLYDNLDNDVKSKVVCREEWWNNADEAVSIIANGHTIFGMEPHTLIMGLAVGIPILHARPISNGRKGWMFRDIGLPEWLYDIDQVSPGTLINELKQIYSNYPLAKEKVRKAMAVVTQRQKVSMDVIKKLANNKS